MINVSKYTIHDSILSNFQFMCCLFSSSPKKLPKKNKSKHHHHHKIIQIKHKIQNLQNIQNQKTERTQPWKEAVQIRFENTMPRGNRILDLLFFGQVARGNGERKTGSCGISRGKNMVPTILLMEKIRR